MFGMNSLLADNVFYLNLLIQNAKMFHKVYYATLICNSHLVMSHLSKPCSIIFSDFGVAAFLVSHRT